MFQSLIQSLKVALEKYPWVCELAGILPLSALIDFIDIPPKLHILELAGSVPLWSWPITPSGSRLLLSKPDEVSGKPVRQDCCMDRFGNSPALEALDGRYGDRYFVSSPETLRLILSGSQVVPIDNNHLNMTDENLIRRVQNVEIIHVMRRGSDPSPREVSETSSEQPLQASSPASSLFSARRYFRGIIIALRQTPFLYVVTSFSGWILWISTLLISGFFELWICFSFVLLLPATGIVVSLLFGTGPRKLLVEAPSNYVRLVIIAEHMNTDSWKLVIGESSIVNSLLNRPLQPSRSWLSSAWTFALRQLLRLCILGQWGLAIGAAATKRWDAYLICFWIALPIFSHAYLISPSFCARGWLEKRTMVHVKRYNTQTSTRRSLLNLIVALNPDSFNTYQDNEPDYTHLAKGGMKWLDPILSESTSRSEWENATLEATPIALETLKSKSIDGADVQDPSSDFPDKAWNIKHRMFKHDRKTGETKEVNYWRRFIPEGIYLAAKIKMEADLPKAKTV
ncbi:peptidase family M3 [Fusarium pseudocircinatum]|uniref:Peptidase family M3 n=1 Tax=Fusarium pseudocircinatum TaxID=56676 RepID=A0A8H5NY21_9HYPO|nr:peptidase family M3 [Fusarium pseudocircinatum]